MLRLARSIFKALQLKKEQLILLDELFFFESSNLF